MPSPGGEKLCPICDSPLQPGSKKCSFCGTDISIFEIDFGAPKEAPKEPPKPVIPSTPRPSMEARIEEIFSRPSARPPPQAEAPKAAASVLTQPAAPAPSPAAPKFEPVKAVPAPPATAPRPLEVSAPRAKAVAKEEMFDCPECGARLPISAKLCTKCGVMFADEESEVFECPACSTLVGVDAKSCPGCGAVFVESEEAAPVGEGEVPTPLAKPPSGEVKVAAPAAAAPGAAQAVGEAEEEARRKRGLLGWLGREKKAPRPGEVEAEPARPAIRPEAQPVAPPRVAPVIEQFRPREEPSVVREERVLPTSPRDKGKELARMVAEMKQLLALARDKDVEIGESKQLIDDAAAAGREKDLDKAIMLVKRSRAILMTNIEGRLKNTVSELEEQIRVAKELGGDVSRSSTYIKEATRAQGAGDIEAAFVYADKIEKELQPVIGRYKDSKKKLESLKQLIAESESFFVDTREVRNVLVEATRAFEARDFGRADSIVKSAEDRLFRAIPDRINEEIRRAKEQLLEAKMRNVNITPMITSLKAATRMLKAGDYGQAMREMKDFRDQMKSVSK